jgi:rubrerythrin
MNRNVYELLKKASACELKAAEAYSHFAEKFSSDKAAQGFWDVLATDENEHAQFISKILAELTKDQGMMETQQSQWNPIDQLLLYLKNNSYHDITTVHEAYQYTEKIESYEVTTIVQIVAQECIPKSQRTELLHKQLNEHYKLIEKFGNNKE